MSADAPALSAPAGLTILRCPRCAAAEPVETAALGEARMISCRRCGGAWPARQGASAALAPAAIEAGAWPSGAEGAAAGAGWAAQILADEPPPRAPRRRPWRALLAGLALVAVLAAAGLAAGREAAVAAMPDLAGLYAAIGLAVHRDGLAVEAVQAERRFGDTSVAIAVGGRVVNVGAAERPVPPLLIQFRGPDGAILHGASADAPVKRLAPGAAARFVVEVDSVPKEAGEVLVRLGEAR